MVRRNVWTWGVVEQGIGAMIGGVRGSVAVIFVERGVQEGERCEGSCWLMGWEVTDG